MTKTQTLSVRMETELLERLARLEKDTGIERASVVRAAIAAALDFYDGNGFLSFPLKITPASVIAPASGPRQH